MLLLWKRRRYMLPQTTTPDNYQVNKDGAWIVDGGVQLQFDLEENAGNY